MATTTPHGDIQVELEGESRSHALKVQDSTSCVDGSEQQLLDGVEVIL